MLSKLLYVTASGNVLGVFSNFGLKLCHRMNYNRQLLRIQVLSMEAVAHQHIDHH
jgi:hypothetical protein